MPLAIAYKASFVIMLLVTPFVFRLWSGIKENEERARWVFALTMLISLTLSPHVNCYDCVLVGIAAMLTRCLPSVQSKFGNCKTT